jgi:regulator of sigma E protease
MSDGKKTILVDELNDITTGTKEFAGKNITIQLKRGEQNLTVQATPRKNPPKSEGSLGIVISNFIIKKYSIIEAPFYGLVEAVKTTAIIFKELALALVRFVTFQGSQIQVAGPVGIAKLTGSAARIGLDALLQLVGILSLNLAVINILPFPALDGGRLAFVIYETITRKRINPKVEQRLNFAGFAILISLILLVTVSDVINLFK